MRCLLASRPLPSPSKSIPRRRRLRRPRRGKLGQGWRQRTSALNEMNAPARVDPRMCNGTCRATASTHAKDGTTVRTTTGQTRHGQYAGPVRAGGANLIPLESEGVHAQQGMGIVDAVPIPDKMLQRGGEAQPSPFLGMKRRGRGRAWTWALDKTRLHGTMQIALRKRRFSHLLKHAFHGGCFDAQGPRMLQCDPSTPASSASRPSEERAGERLRPPRDGPPPRAPAEPRVGQHGERLEAVGDGNRRIIQIRPR